MIDKHSGEARSRVVPTVTAATLGKVMQEQVETRRSLLHTDQASWYQLVGQMFLLHEAVDHSAGEYARGDVSTNVVEGFFSQLKRSLDGTHHHVSRTHLHRYVSEFAFRYTTRKMNDGERVRVLVGRVGARRLAYRPLATARRSS